MPYQIENRRSIGCKAKLADWIFENIEKETKDAHSFCDIFAGTGSISNRAVDRYENVIINDFLYSNNVLYNAFFGKGEWDEKKIFKILEDFNNVDISSLQDNFFSNNYGGKYFDMQSARKIGYIRDEIESRKSILTYKEYCILLASLIYSIDRISNTVGHFESYRKIKIEPRDFDMLPISVRSFEGVEIYRDDANALSRKIKCDIVYIDPPYNSRQYSRFYHVYEVLVKWDNPRLYYDAAKPNFSENNSVYCRVGALLAFQDLVAHVKAKYIIVSYNNTYNPKSSTSANKIKLEEIKDTLDKCGETKVFTHSYNPFNAGKTDFDDHKEYLFITKVNNERRNSSFATILRG